MLVKSIIIGLVLALCLYFVNSLTGKVADAEKRATESERLYQELRVKTTEVANAALQESIKKLKVANELIIANEVQYNTTIQKLQLNVERETKALKELYEKRIDGTTHNWSERLRLEREARSINSSSGMSKGASSTEGPTENERECYGAFTTLEAACQLTTAQFNSCRGWIDTACNKIGCETN